jgi:hypothetical protein
MGATTRLNGGVTMIGTGPDDKIYSVVKLTTVLNALADEGVSTEDALAAAAERQQSISGVQRKWCARVRYAHSTLPGSSRPTS